MNVYMTSELGRLHREALIEEACHGRLAAMVRRSSSMERGAARPSIGRLPAWATSLRGRFFDYVRHAIVGVEPAADCR
jgi:hypothetical protein